MAGGFDSAQKSGLTLPECGAVAVANLAALVKDAAKQETASPKVTSKAMTLEGGAESTQREWSPDPTEERKIIASGGGTGLTKVETPSTHQLGASDRDYNMVTRIPGIESGELNLTISAESEELLRLAAASISNKLFSKTGRT